jgi:hypothetical protein
LLGSPPPDTFGPPMGARGYSPEQTLLVDWAQFVLPSQLLPPTSSSSPTPSKSTANPIFQIYLLSSPNATCFLRAPLIEFSYQWVAFLSFDQKTGWKFSSKFTNQGALKESLTLSESQVPYAHKANKTIPKGVDRWACPCKLRHTQQWQ